MPKVIEWVNPGENDIVWKYPSEEIAWGDILIVKEYEAAVFFRDGKAYDVFRAGRHVLTTMNLPLLTRVLSRIAGFDKVPFRATIIFVSLKQFMGKFGGQGQTTELAPLKFFGSFWFRIEDPNLFVNEVVGGKNTYTTDSLQEFLRGYFNERLIDTLSQYSLAQVYGKLDETSFLAKNALYDSFKRLGIELIDTKFEGLDTTPEWRDRLFYIRQGAAATEVLRMETVKKAAESLGQSQGAGVGAGLLLPAMIQQPAQQVQVACPHCGFLNPQNVTYCGRCGKPLAPQSTSQQTVQEKCPNCGNIVQPIWKVCPNCGNRLKPYNCPSCNSEVPPNAKFCPNCGTKLI
jgi:membrane protease subunit (stomatin/prohibitin family)